MLQDDKQKQALERRMDGPVAAAYISHRLDGRVRLQIPEKKRDAAWFRALAEALSTQPGVRQIQVNPIVGSILILHTEPLRDLVEFARRAGYFVLTEPNLSVETPAQRLAGSLESLDRRISEATTGRWDLQSVAVVGLAVAGFYQILRLQIWPASATLLLNAWRLLPHRPQALPVQELEDDLPLQ